MVVANSPRRPKRPAFRSRHVTYGGHSLEPLFVDIDRVYYARDVATLRNSIGGDHVEPLVSAMGRTLGYRCPYVNKKDIYTVRFGVSILGGDQNAFLAGFGCLSKKNAEREHAVLVRDWRLVCVDWRPLPGNSLGQSLSGLRAQPIS